MAEQTTSEQEEKPNVEPLPVVTGSTAVVPAQTPKLEFTESKQEIGTRLTSLISTFRDEAEQQDEILSGLQKEAVNNPNFGQPSHVTQWTVHEVCYWLASIDLQDSVDAFYRRNIDGTILLNDITEDLLKNELNVKSIHCSKLLREIESLKKHSTETLDRNGGNLNDIIATIKKENEELLSELQRQKSLNTDLNPNHDEFHSIPNRIKADEATDDQSLRDIIESQNKIIEDLTSQLQQLQLVSSKRMKELQKKNKKLQDGYIEIETHYQKQLEHSRVQSKSLQAQISSMNDNDSGQIGLLWAENEYTAKDLENEREKRIMLEASLKTMQVNLNREQQKRKLLESQTSRLTAELTKYLTSTIDEEDTNTDADTTQPSQQRFARFKLNKHKSKSHTADHANEVKTSDAAVTTELDVNTATPNTLTVSDPTHNKFALRRKPSMDAKAGWLKFLSTAGGMGNKLNNIQQKWARGRSDDSVEDQKESKEMDTAAVVDAEEDWNDSELASKARAPQRKVTLGETVLKTFKKIQSAAHQKMEERANKKQQKNINYDDTKFVDIADVVNVNGNINANDARKNGLNGMDNDDDEKVEYVADEDSSAEEAHQIVVTEPPLDKKKEKEKQREREDSFAKKGDGAIGMEFTPDMVALPQVVEPDGSF